MSIFCRGSTNKALCYERKKIDSRFFFNFIFLRKKAQKMNFLYLSFYEIWIHDSSTFFFVLKLLDQSFALLGSSHVLDYRIFKLCVRHPRLSCLKKLNFIIQSIFRFNFLSFSFFSKNSDRFLKFWVLRLTKMFGADEHPGKVETRGFSVDSMEGNNPPPRGACEKFIFGFVDDFSESHNPWRVNGLCESPNSIFAAVS